MAGRTTLTLVDPGSPPCPVEPSPVASPHLRPGRPLASIRLDVDPDRLDAAPLTAIVLRQIADDMERAVALRVSDDQKRALLRDAVGKGRSMLNGGRPTRRRYGKPTP